METKTDCRVTLDGLPDFCSIDDFAQVVSVSRATMYRMARQGKLPCLRIGKRIVLSREHLEQWINESMEVK